MQYRMRNMKSNHDTRRPHSLTTARNVADGVEQEIDVKYQNAALVLPLLAAIAAGCTTMGTGYGSSPSGASPVTFSWKSSDGVSGTMNATFSHGTTYSGQYFQITRDMTVDSVAPLWVGW